MQTLAASIRKFYMTHGGSQLTCNTDVCRRASGRQRRQRRACSIRLRLPAQNHIVRAGKSECASGCAWVASGYNNNCMCAERSAANAVMRALQRTALSNANAKRASLSGRASNRACVDVLVVAGRKPCERSQCHYCAILYTRVSSVS